MYYYIIKYIKIRGPKFLHIFILPFAFTISGGQENSPTFLNEQSDVNNPLNGGANMNGSTGMKKDTSDLIIGSWNDEDAEKVMTVTPCYAIHYFII